MDTRIQSAIEAAACDTLGQLGPSLVNLGVYTMWTPKVGVTALTAGAAANFAYRYACSEMDLGEAPDTRTERGCLETSEGTMAVYRAGGGDTARMAGSVTGWYVEPAGVPHPTPGWEYWQAYIQTSVGGSYSPVGSYWSKQEGAWFEGLPYDGAVCGKPAPDPIAPLPPVTPYTYTDPETNCQLTLNLLGFTETYQYGPVAPVYEVFSPPTEGRASGGRMGGCVFPKTIVVAPIGGDGGGGGGGGPRPIPVPTPQPPDGDDKPWWLDLVKGALSGVVAGVTEEIIERLLPPEKAPSTTYRLVSVCETDEDGEAISQSVEVPIPELSVDQGQVARLDALVELLQGHKNFKQPICAPQQEKIEGDWRTISFVSEKSSPYGKSRLRKRFRYRSVSGWTDDALIDHWKDFTWTSGPIVVKHLGASWGTPQVWAASADEGKRVIRHAAGEAGIDPDQVGRWQVSGARGSRCGVSDTMRVETKGGYYWITARDGSDSRPQVGLLPQP